MKLHAPDWILFVPHAHDLALGFGLGGDLQAIGNRIAFDDQRMIPSRVERLWHAGEDFLVVVMNGRSLSMHEPVGANDFAAENMADALMTEANSEKWNLRPELLDDCVRHARFPG